MKPDRLTPPARGAAMRDAPAPAWLSPGHGAPVSWAAIGGTCATKALPSTREIERRAGGAVGVPGLATGAAVGSVHVVTSSGKSADQVWPSGWVWWMRGCVISELDRVRHTRCPHRSPSWRCRSCPCRSCQTGGGASVYVRRVTPVITW
jgi:hypothetical protein